MRNRINRGPGFIRMPFGLKNAGLAFQRTMHVSLRSSQSHDVETYVGNIEEEARQPKPSPRDLSEDFNDLRITR